MVACCNGKVDMDLDLTDKGFIDILNDDSLGFQAGILPAVKSSVCSFAQGTKMQKEVDMQGKFADFRGLLKKCTGNAAAVQTDVKSGATDCGGAKTKLGQIKAACDADGQEAVDSCTE